MGHSISPLQNSAYTLQHVQVNGRLISFIMTFIFQDTEIGAVVFDLSKKVYDNDVSSVSTLTYKLLQHNIREVSSFGKCHRYNPVNKRFCFENFSFVSIKVFK